MYQIHIYEILKILTVDITLIRKNKNQLPQMLNAWIKNVLIFRTLNWLKFSTSPDLFPEKDSYECVRTKLFLERRTNKNYMHPVHTERKLYIYIKRTAKYIFNFTYGNNIINNETNDV